MKINDEGSSNAAHWHERAMKAGARLQKIMARCADLLDEDQFNELDALARLTDSAIPVQPNGVTGCICKGNWRAIVKEMEPWLDKKFTDQHGQEWTFYGIVHGSDDYYYGVARAGETHLLSCVGALESYGYEPVATDPTDAAP